MPLFMDIHDKVEGATAADVADAHRKDLEIQDDHDVRYLRYWFNEETGRIVRLAEGPSREAVDRVHKLSHGLAADEILEVVEGS
jgi:Protein of unknown function (DUF4242)